VRIPGTLNRKGDSTENRPQRYAEIISIPEDPEPVPIDLLSALANDSADEGNSSSRENITESRPGTLNVQDYLSHHGRKLRRTKQHGDSVLYILEECVFDSDHKGGDASIGKQKTGKLFYQCFHNSCKERTWKEARKIISGNDSLDPFMISSWNQLKSNISAKNETDVGHDQNIEIVSFADILCMPKDTTPQGRRDFCVVPSRR